jgi:hypothetical protein
VRVRVLLEEDLLEPDPQFVQQDAEVGRDRAAGATEQGHGCPLLEV